MAETDIIPIVNISGDVYDRPYTIVTSQIDLMNTRADTALSTSYAAMQQLANFQLPQEGTPPDLRPVPVQVGDYADVALPAAQLFGRVPDFDEPAFDDLLSLVADIDPGAAPIFDPSIIALNIPAPPPAIDTSGAPVRPTIDTPDMPSAPDTTIPTMDALLTIDIPGAPTINLPTFDVVVPTFDDAVPTLGLDWEEPTYAPTVLDEVAATVRSMLVGDFAMPKVVQDALVSAARDREDMVAHKAVQDAFGDWAGRGFDMPPGMLVEAVATARENSQLQVQSLSRDVMTKAAEWAIENLRTAVQQGIALETVLINQFNNLAQRAFEMARQRVQVEFDRYNLRVAAYNATLQGLDTRVRVFQAAVQAELSKLEVYKAEIEAEQLKSGINEQQVRIYQARLQALTTIVDVYKTRVDAVRVQTDLERGKVDLYRADVQAYAERLSAQKIAFDAYDSQVRGEAAKAGILESEARAFAATVEGYSSANNVKVQIAQTRLRAVEAGTQKYTALLQAERERVQAGLEQIQAQVSTFSADTSRYSTQVNFQSQKNDALVRASEATARNYMAYFEVVSRQFDSRMTRMIEQSRLLESAIQAAGSMASQLAAGAMSATHVQASLAGSGSAALSMSNSYNVSHSLDADNSDQSI